MPGSAQPLPKSASNSQGFAVRLGLVHPVPQPDDRKQRSADCKNRHAGANGMTKTLIGVGLAMGMGWTAWFAAPAIALASVIIAQGGVPDFSVRDWANLGGFAIFAGAMYYLHRQTLADFRSDMREERASRSTLTDAVNENTYATKEYTEVNRELVAVLRHKAGV